MLLLTNSSAQSKAIRLQEARMNITPLQARDRQGDGFFCTFATWVNISLTHCTLGLLRCITLMIYVLRNGSFDAALPWLCWQHRHLQARRLFKFYTGILFSAGGACWERSCPASRAALGTTYRKGVSHGCAGGTLIFWHLEGK